MIKKLLQAHGAEASDTDGRTAIHYAVITGQPKVCQLLIKYGADIESRDRWGNTGLLTATQRANISMMIMLLKLGADISNGDRDGRTALHWACLY